MQLRSVMRAGELRGKRVFVCVDLNAPKESAKLDRALLTVQALLKRGAKIVLATHVGRPDGKKVASLSTKHLVPFLQKSLGVPVKHVSDIGGALSQKAVAAQRAGSIVLLENVRFDPGEEENSPVLAKKLAALADLYVNDAFAVSHRAHASVVGITAHLPSYAGLLVIEEVEHLLRSVEAPGTSEVVVIGGAKISTKIEILERFLKKGAKVLIGGALANNFFKAAGLEVGKSLWERGEVALAQKLLRHKNLYLPDDVVAVKQMKAGASVRMIPPTALSRDEIMVDIGLATLCDYRAMIDRAKTVVWNGPMGVTEIPDFAHGSIMIGRAIAKRTEYGAYSVVGGGDTLPILPMAGMEHAYSFVSTGGGAMLEFLSGRMLPGLIPLVQK